MSDKTKTPSENEVASIGLLGCFCGGTPQVVHDIKDKTRGAIVKCGCGARVQCYCGGPEDYYTIEWLESIAKMKWNKRHPNGKDARPDENL